MNEVIRELNPPMLVRIMSHAQTLRAALGGEPLGDAPHSLEAMESAWAKLVVYPVDPEDSEWLITALGALLAEQLQALYSFKWKELEDEYGVSPCLVESRTGVRVFPFDSVARRLQAEEPVFFAPYLRQIEEVMAKEGLDVPPLSVAEPFGVRLHFSRTSARCSA